MNDSPNPLIHIQRGMTVYSSEGDEIGEVDTVYLGQNVQDEKDELTGQITAPDDSVNVEGDHLILEALPEIIHPHDLPAKMIERMLNEGYIRVSRPGLEDVGSIILPDQIDSVSEQGIYLIP
jgi:hypothetical protein